MPNVERVLIEVTTVANMTGIEMAKKGMLGMNVATLAMAATLGVVLVVGKAAIENYKAQEEAANLLSQAYETQKDTLEAHRTKIEQFLTTNARFISNQYDTEAALASLVRAGYAEAESFRILNAALDWSAIKHVDVSVSATTLIKVLAGNQKALRELGITTDQYNAIMKSTLTVEEKHAELLALIEARTAKGRDTIDSSVQSTNALTIAWQNFTAKTGPNVIEIIKGITDAAATGLGILTVYVDLLNKLAAIGPFGSSGGRAITVPGSRLALPRGVRAAASGVSETVSQPTLFLAGEGGAAEDVNIGPKGSGGRGGNITVHFHIDSFYGDGPGIDRLANAVAQRLSYVTGR